MHAMALRALRRKAAHTRPGRWAQEKTGAAADAARTVAVLDHPAWLYRSDAEVPSVDFHYCAPRTIGHDDVVLCERLLEAHDCAQSDGAATSGMWADETVQSRQRELTGALASRDPSLLAQRLASMFRSNFILGMAYGSFGVERQSLLTRRIWPMYILGKLARLAESQAATHMENPEQGKAGLALANGLDAVVSDTESALGVSIGFPDVGAPYGILAAGRLIPFDSPDQIYAAARIKGAAETHLPERDGPLRIVEIGAGYGGMAYWLAQMTSASYTIIDLPLVNVLQGYFLAKCLGEDQVSFYRERQRRITVLPTHALSSVTLPFHVLANKDSLPEIPREAAIDYLLWAQTGCDGLFYSYNQEAAAATRDGAQNVVAELVTHSGGFRRLRRDASWLRRGYAEEIYIPAAWRSG